MCDYSLHHVASRPAKVGEALVSTGFPSTHTRGFASPSDPKVAVCLLPGTELAFEQNVRRDEFLLFSRSIGEKVARFRQVHLDMPHSHHDALEFPTGRVVLLTELSTGQRATVLQLPPTELPAKVGEGIARSAEQIDRPVDRVRRAEVESGAGGGA